MNSQSVDERWEPRKATAEVWKQIETGFGTRLDSFWGDFEAKTCWKTTWELRGGRHRIDHFNSIIILRLDWRLQHKIHK